MNGQISHKLSGRIAVKNGQCPNGHSLMSDETRFEGLKSVRVKIKIAGKQGELFLDPVYGRFNYFSELSMKDGDIVEAFCPQCNVSLSIETNCAMCNIHMFAIQLPDGGEVEVCPKVDCHNHALKIVDIDEQLSRMYLDETKFQM